MICRFVKTVENDLGVFVETVFHRILNGGAYADGLYGLSIGSVYPGTFVAEIHVRRDDEWYAGHGRDPRGDPRRYPRMGVDQLPAIAAYP